jgi:hypothetical protein
MPGDDRAEARETAGDEDRALGIERRRLRLGPVAAGGCHSRHQEIAIAQRDLRLALERERGLEDRLGGLAAIAVDQQEAARVFRLGGTDQSPKGGDGRIRRPLAGKRHGALTEECEPAAGALLDSRLKSLQPPIGELVGGLRGAGAGIERRWAKQLDLTWPG